MLIGEVIIATYNREKELPVCLKHIEESTVQPKRIIIIDATPNDKFPSYSFNYNGTLNINYIRTDKSGLTVQRNIGIEKLLDETDVVTFLDDDFYVDSDYFENLYASFESDSSLAGAQGALHRDGKVICTLPQEDKPVKNLYGCNMSYRKSAIGNLRFDEKLKMYAFKEDWDFSYSVYEKNGKLMMLHKCKGVHDQSQDKPVNDRKMGYMVVANDCYIKRKHGIFSAKDMIFYFAYMARHLVNIYKKRSRERFIGAVKGFWNVVIMRHELG
jgi:glycosyltransferase involved in cell wall biosynthesis